MVFLALCFIDFGKERVPLSPPPIMTKQELGLTICFRRVREGEGPT